MWRDGVTARSDERRATWTAAILRRSSSSVEVPPPGTVRADWRSRIALEQAGVAVTILEAAGYTHGQANAQIGVPGETVITPTIATFTRDCLGGVC